MAFTDRSLETRSYTFGAIALHALGPIVCFLFVMFVVPRFATVLSDMIDGNTPLPVLTQKVLNISSHMQTWWYAYLIMLVILLTLDAVLYRRLSAASQAGAQVWSVLALLTGGAAVMLLVVAMFLPVARIITNVAE
jgi:type II secretory pathway component PulF